jgi:hypothetical protein
MATTWDAGINICQPPQSNRNFERFMVKSRAVHSRKNSERAISRAVKSVDHNGKANLEGKK